MQNNRKNFYSAYGLTIESQIGLPGLKTHVKTEGLEPDVIFKIEKIRPADLKRLLGEAKTYEAPGCDVRASENAMFFDYHSGPSILVTAGNEVIFDLRGTHESDVTPYLTGYVLAVLLLQRGLLVLHASVVTASGRALAFLGAKGDGKSTIAAGLNARGYSLVSDDHLPIVFRDRSVLTLPGYPQIRLFADSVEAVGATTASLVPVHPLTDKFMLPSANGFSMDEVPLSAVYLLDVDEDVSIERLHPSKAFIEAVRHTHVNYYLKDANVQEQHFADCDRLVTSVPFFVLRRPRDFGKMSLVAEMIEEHFKGLK